MSKPKVGIYGLTSCAGDQLAILNLEDELLDLAGAIELIDFPMAMSGNDQKTPLDIALVEGSVVSQHDVEALKKIRERAKVAIERRADIRPFVLRGAVTDRALLLILPFGGSLMSFLGGSGS